MSVGIQVHVCAYLKTKSACYTFPAEWIECWVDAMRVLIYYGRMSCVVGRRVPEHHPRYGKYFNFKNVFLPSSL